MACDTCPFSLSQAACEAQNLGCLPTPQEIMRIHRDQGRNWACHGDERRICAGLVAACREQGIALDKQAPLALYSRWYHEGAG